MGFEVYLDCFEDGKPSGIRRSLVRTFFPIVAEESQRDFWSVRYDATNACKIAVRGAEFISHICVERPCGDLLLWEGLFQLTRAFNIVLYFPGCTQPLIANPVAARHIPVEMIASLGPPRSLESAEELRLAISQG